MAVSEGHRRILVTDGEQRAALATVRSLGAAGHTVFVCSTRPRSLAGASRYAHGHVAVPSPLECPDEFTLALRELVARWDVEVLLPITEPAIYAILGDSTLTQRVTVPFPCLDRFRRICDKAAVMEAGRDVGIAVPAESRLDRPPARSDLLELPYPVVVKPSRSVVEVAGRRVKSSVRYAATPRELERVLEGLDPAFYPLLLQERVEGPGAGVFLLMAEGEVLARFAHRRIREKPPSGGVSVVRESVPVATGLLERSARLLDQFGWWGVAMVEYKWSRDTGEPYLMEVNGRLWGSLQLAIDAGVDFPRLLVQLGTGSRPAPVPGYHVGVRERWLLGDVDHLLLRLRRRSSQLALPADAPGRGRVVLDFIRDFGPRTRNEVFRIHDPAPALRELLDWLKGG